MESKVETLLNGKRTLTMVAIAFIVMLFTQHFLIRVLDFDAAWSTIIAFWTGVLFMVLRLRKLRVVPQND